jgi:uncharacterized protein (DUF1810 family)
MKYRDQLLSSKRDYGASSEPLDVVCVSAVARFGIESDLNFYGISSLDEARAYLAHPMLGPRLDQATRLVLNVVGRSLAEIFGSPDDLKFCSSMTLFAKAADPGNIFASALLAKCGGPDGRTERLLSAQQ